MLARSDGTILEANPAAIRTFQRPPSDLLRSNLAELVVPDDRAPFSQWLVGLSRDDAQFETLCLSDEGRAIPYEVTARCVDIGDAERVFCSMRIDDRRSLLDRARALAAIVETSDDAIIGKALDGTVTSWNPAAERMYGWSAKEMVGGSVTRIIPEDRREEFYDILARLSRNERVDHHETVRVARDGRRLDVSISISPILDKSGRVIGAAKIGRDVTERRRLERQQREFLLLAAHELRTPLTSLKVSAQLLERRTSGDDQLVSWIINRIGHLGHLIDDLVDAARFDADPILTRSDTDLVQLARATVADWQMRSGRHDLRLEVGVEPVVGFWDATRIEQVLSALLENAITYAPDGEIVVRVERLEGAARMVVRDRGPGIPPEHVSSLFNRFVRLEAPGMNVVPGLGLGLFHCRTLVEAHGGTIWVEPTPDGGATFVVELPLREID